MKSHGSRKFYQLPEPPSSSECGEDSNGSTKTKKYRSKSAFFRGSTRDLIEMVDQNIIGKETVFQGPFGPRRSVYMDHTASGQSLRCIEDYVQEYVLPYYGNTHTTSTITSSQTTMFRHEAKDIVRNSVGASEHDVVIFCGFGSTGAIHKLVQAVIGGRTSPIVFVGPHEHHSNILPWKDSGAEVVYIPESEDGVLDIKALEKELSKAKSNQNEDQLLIGSFSVASNITGIPVDDVAVTILMHKYGGLAFFDYSAAAPHVQISMNPIVNNSQEAGLGKKDAIFFSGHKFVGGPQTPGVLIAKKSIFENPIPNGGGGGSVFFVTQDSHRYLQNIEYREEGGTPAIIESIRLGLIFRLKEAVGASNIISREAVFTKKMLSEWSKYPEIKILGSKTKPRLGIVSFVVEHLQSGYLLHHNFIVSLLNDLFGIQSRGGCACAGPYGQALLGIDINLAHDFENLLLEDSRLDRTHLRRDQYLEGSKHEGFRPGFVRISIPYHASAQDADYVVEAVQIVARHGYKLLPLYNFNPETGEFHHPANHTFQHRKWLSWATFDADGIKSKERTRNNSEDYPNYRECIEQAKNIISNSYNLCKRRSLADQTLMYDPSISKLRWFLLPSEALKLVEVVKNSSITGLDEIKSSKPFVPKIYKDQNQIHDVADDKVKNVEPYYQNSIPTQILQSNSWSHPEPSILSTASNHHRMAADFDSGMSHSNSSDMNFSNNENEEDNDHDLFETAGATVTGPSICFSFGSSCEDKSSSVDAEVEDYLAGGDVKFNELNRDLNFGNTNTATMNNLDQTNYYQQINKNECSTNELVNSSNELPQQQQFNINPQTQELIQSQQLSSPVFNNYSPLPVTNLGCLNNNNNNNNGFINSPESPLPSTDYSNSLNSFPQSQVNGMGDPNSTYPTYVQSNPATCTQPQVESYQQSYCSSPGYLQPQNSIDNNCPIDCNIASSSPVLAFSPTPYNYPGNYFVDQTNTFPLLNSPTQPYQQSFSSDPFQKFQSSFTGTVENGVNEQIVEHAMRRVTDEMATLLKSEIRGVINQVEQGIDPNGIRERANSFTLKDKNIESLKRRTRTLSGHILSSLGKSEDKEPKTTIEKKELKEKETISKEQNNLYHAENVCSIKPKKLSKDCIECKPRMDTDADLNDDLDNEAESKWHCPSKLVFKPTLKALREYSMIKDGDKILVCLSGGKDSLSLLHTIKQAQHVLAKEGISFTFGAVTVDPKHSGYNPSSLIPYLKSLNVPYFYEEQGIMDSALEKGPEGVSSICSFCSRMKRGRIYAAARRNGYNVLALGQHLDDLAESFFMSVFHNGFLRTMKASYTVKEGDLRVIRPFVYVREKELRQFAESRHLPIIPENCPACFEAPTERHRVKQLLAHQEILFPKMFLSLCSAMKPLMAIDRTGLESKRSVKEFESVLTNEEEELP